LIFIFYYIGYTISGVVVIQFLKQATSWSILIWSVFLYSLAWYITNSHITLIYFSIRHYFVSVALVYLFKVSRYVCIYFMVALSSFLSAEKLRVEVKISSCQHFVVPRNLFSHSIFGVDAVAQASE
jgi:hypothetical protein